MKIINTKGNELINRPDYSKGRLIEKDIDTLIYTTWEELPDKDEKGNIISHDEKPTELDRISAIEDTISVLI